jgi:rubrerythrin
MTDEHQQLLTFLRELYLDESKDILNFTDHAERMYYPHLRQRLLHMVEEERAHTRWLKEQIHLLGGHVPTLSFSPARGANTWESLLRDLEEERKDEATFLTGLRLAEHLNPEIAKGLARLRFDERRHREQLRELLYKSEPDAVPVPASQSTEMEQQKRTWLAEEKMVWLEQRRAAWEAEGKLIPWPEWIARREYEWTANELPNRELRWAREYNVLTATEDLVPRVSESRG